ncbi:MAG: hypothetical protein IT389_00115 [Nitrospira sp.]|nr:hypothetical protein [Nitrospira sp.]
MLKIMISQSADRTRVALAGRLVGPWVEELRRCWDEADADRRERWRVDLRETTHVDSEGKALLSEMFRQGATFQAQGCLMLAIVEGLAAAPGARS